MPMFSLVAAAAAAASSPLPTATEADMRCFVTYLVMVGSEKDEAKKNSLLAATAYYVGRLDARMGATDWSPHIRRIASEATFMKNLGSEGSRCSVEAGTALQTAGTTAQKVAKELM